LANKHKFPYDEDPKDKQLVTEKEKFGNQKEEL